MVCKETGYYAHSPSESGFPELLNSHLLDVANRSAQFAEVFSASQEAYLCGLFHDVGKYGELFQLRLKGKEKKIDHWSLGAWLVLSKYKQKGLASALVIQGHHTGLQWASKEALRSLDPEKLKTNHPLGLRLSATDVEEILNLMKKDGITPPAETEMSSSLYPGLSSPPAAGMLDIRMLFSALVDADFIETEAHYQRDAEGIKKYRLSGPQLNPGRDLLILLNYLRKLAEQSKASTEIMALRNDLLRVCSKAGELEQGLFTLTAPTGAGKTLSMLAFALKHSLKHNLRRIVVVIPYLTIIEQTVREYHKVFSSAFTPEYLRQYILEDHSLAGTRARQGSDYTEDLDMENEVWRISHLLAENWDAPIIITTNVQFFESLFSNRPSSCRKLHRLAKSVILFDEIQTMPIKIIIPTLATLMHLCKRYNASIVFSTATQPAFNILKEHIKEYCGDVWEPREIVPEELNLFKRKKRYVINWGNEENLSWEALAQKLTLHHQVLCIVNLKRHASTLFDNLKKLSPEGLFHLSTNMCPAHRENVLNQIVKRLKQSLTCRVISTQCVEAGVDLDFPVVYRAFGPLDAIAQAAGRCNRNGNIERGEVYIFYPEEEKYPDRTYQQAAGAARIVLKKQKFQLDEIPGELFTEYYREFFDIAKPENKNQQLQDAIKMRNFEVVAKEYHIIDKNTINLLVPYDIEKFHQLAEEARSKGLNREWIAKARAYSISIFRPRSINAPICRWLEPVPIGKNGFSEEWFIYLREEHYDPDKGLIPSENLECLIG